MVIRPPRARRDQVWTTGPYPHSKPADSGSRPDHAASRDGQALAVLPSSGDVRRSVLTPPRCRSRGRVGVQDCAGAGSVFPAYREGMNSLAQPGQEPQGHVGMVYPTAAVRDERLAAFVGTGPTLCGTAQERAVCSGWVGGCPLPGHFLAVSPALTFLRAWRGSAPSLTRMPRPQRSQVE